MQLTPQHEARFWAKVNKTDTCWLWTAHTIKGGYGHFRVGNKMILAHRLSFELTTGVSAPREMMVMHGCDVPACVNPDHLSLGTAKDNVADMAKKGRAKLPSWFPLNRGDDHPRVKLTKEQVLEIRRRTCESRSGIAVEFNTTHQNISAIVNRKRWSHI